MFSKYFQQYSIFSDNYFKTFYRFVFSSFGITSQNRRLYFSIFHLFLIHTASVDNVDNPVYNLYLQQNRAFFVWITYFSTFSDF